MRKSEFEMGLTIGIATGRLSLLRDNDNRNLFYSSQMHEPEEEGKMYLLELYEDYFMLRYDLIFDNSVERFFYLSKDKFEYTEESLKEALYILRKMEQKVYDIISTLKIKGFYTKSEFIRRLLYLMPELELSGNYIKNRSSGKIFIFIRTDDLHLVYKEGNLESYIDFYPKDFNEKILKQCIELIKSSM